jgi:hypothetical protein
LEQTSHPVADCGTTWEPASELQLVLCYRKVMRGRLSWQTAAAMAFRIALLTLISVLIACHVRDGDQGSIRVKPGRVVGVYETRFDQGGSEVLELKSDGTYIQDFSSKSRSVHHTGRWRIENNFLDGSQVVLANAFVSEEDESRPLGFGELPLFTHDHAGKVALARNEVSGWYYEPTH